MKIINLPGTDVAITQAIFGTSRLGGTVESYNKKESLEILSKALDSGITTFDTADIYAQGNSERLLAEAFQGRRDQVVYATKGGYVLSSKARVLAKVKPLVRGFIRSKSGLTKAAGRARGGQMARDFSRAHLTRAVEASLKRLRTDTIDIYQLHSPTGSHLRNTDAFETLADLKQAGKIRAYGVSLLSWDDLPLCLNQGVSWAQVDADLFGNTPHHNWHEMAAGDGLLLIARQVFASGLLTRTPDSLTADDFDGDQAKLDHTRRMLNSLSGTGDPFGTIMRYFMHHSPFGAFLFATTRTTNLRTNLGALCMPEFIGEDFEVIKTLFPTPRSPEL